MIFSNCLVDQHAAFVIHKAGSINWICSKTKPKVPFDLEVRKMQIRIKFEIQYLTLTHFRRGLMQGLMDCKLTQGSEKQSSVQMWFNILILRLLLNVWVAAPSLGLFYCRLDISILETVFVCLCETVRSNNPSCLFSDNYTTCSIYRL